MSKRKTKKSGFGSRFLTMLLVLGLSAGMVGVITHFVSDDKSNTPQGDNSSDIVEVTEIILDKSEVIF